MFSNRLDWDTPVNALGLLLADKRARGEPLIDLTQSNPTRVGLSCPVEAILEAMARPDAMIYRPDPRGLMPARHAIARYYSGQGADIDPEALFLTAGTSEAYGMLFKLLADPGDEVLVPRPGYPLLAYLAAFEGLGAVAYPQTYDDVQGWQLDPDLVQALITPKTKAMVLVSPNNPTGAYATPEMLAALDRVCRRHDLALIVDEVFADYPASPPTATHLSALAGRTALTFVLNGFSKMLALPQVKLAWIAVGGAAAAAREAQSRLEILLDFYLSAAAPVQHAAERLLTLRKGIQGQVLARLADNARTLETQIERATHCRLLPRQGGWYAVVRFADAVADDTRALDLLSQTNTLVHPGFFYDFDTEGYVVLSLLPAPETFRAGTVNLLRMYG